MLLCEVLGTLFWGTRLIYLRADLKAKENTQVCRHPGLGVAQFYQGSWADLPGTMKLGRAAREELRLALAGPAQHLERRPADQ